jgi:hypothetical protein
MSDVLPNLLILGGPDSGKSTYRAQLYQRIEHEEGELQLVQSVGDMSALQGDVERLLQGLSPLHTNLDIYNSTTLVVKDGAGREVSLEFADYGGEQIRRISELNTVPAPWVERAQQSSAWLFFLRIDRLRSAKSFMTEPVETTPRLSGALEPLSSEQSGELSAIETLQRLLFVRGASLRDQLAAPRLGIFLSCWDELTDGERKQPPNAILEQRGPLFSRFVQANWKSDEYNLWGLSSTERRLPDKDPDEDFARKGPERAGYVVLNTGNTSADLTIPIGWLMQNP